jgi:tripartite-type tricarboxylate transporter receptor subunit TctC
MQKTAFDPAKDFTYIIGLSGYPFGIVVRPESPWMTSRHFIVAGKAKPGTICTNAVGAGTAASADGGSAAEERRALPARAVQGFGKHELVSAAHRRGLRFVGLGPHVDAGKARLLATFGEQRTKRWPSVPTARSWGSTWFILAVGLAGPKGVDPKVVQILHDGFKRALDDPEHQKILDKLDQVLWYRNTADYARYALETFEAERQTVERLGLLRKD